MKHKSTRLAVLQKLQSIRNYTLDCLKEKSKDIGLSEKSLLFIGAKEHILQKYQSYCDGINCQDGSRIRDFLRESLAIVNGLPAIFFEDAFAT